VGEHEANNVAKSFSEHEMSSRLEELRRRAQEQQAREEIVRASSATPGTPSKGESARPQSFAARTGSEGETAVAGGAMADAVAEFFDQTRGFKQSFDDLLVAIDVLERLGESTVRALGPLQAFQPHLVYLVACFEPVQIFEDSLKQLAENFAPARGLYDEMAELTQALQSELANLVKMIEPARTFRERILAVAQSLEQANALLDELAELESAIVGTQAAAPKQRQPANVKDDLIKSVVQGAVRSDFGDDH
jgi:hypothetical protein